MNIMTLGIDIAKNIFQLCGADNTGKIILRKRLTRNQLQKYIVQLSPCRIVMEACGSANYWSRTFQALGYEVRLIAPQRIAMAILLSGEEYSTNYRKAA